MSYVLVLNSGSSSVKFQLVDPESSATDTPLVSGLVEQVGEPLGAVTVKTGGEKYKEELEIPTHSFGLERAFAIMSEHNVGPTDVDVIAVGHRVVHGGRLFSEPQLIVDQIESMIEDLIPLAPLHNPANLDGIRVARKMLPDIPHVAVFDTAFFNTLPPAAALYAINNEVASKYDIRRYGFHGTSHEFVSQQVPALLGRDPMHTHQITLHLGNGASAAAIRNGRAIDTSMGLTPLAGLAMGTRSGDIDPAIMEFIAKKENLDIDGIMDVLNKKSGVEGLSGVSSDFRDLEAAYHEGNPRAIAACEVFAYRVAKYIGAYVAAMNGVDAIAFTAGIGENTSFIREKILAYFGYLGITMDKEANMVRGEDKIISTPDSKVTVCIIPTNEELAIARETVALVG